MSEFQRSPSKVWWGNNEYASPNAHRINFEQWQQQAHNPEFEEEPSAVIDMNQYEAITSFNTSSRENTPELNKNDTDWLNRNTSGSPNSHKSQDSGFSDSETSNSIPNETVNTGNYIKDCQLTDNTPIKNLNTNYKEKYSPKKCLSSQINYMKKFHSAPTTPEQINSPQPNFSKSLQFPQTIQQPLLIYPNQMENTSNSSPLRQENFEIIVPSNFDIIYQNRPSTASKIHFKSNSSPIASPLPVKSRTENPKFRRSRSSTRPTPKSSPKVNRNLFSCYPSNENSIEDITKLNDDLNWTPQKILENSRLTNHITSPNNSPRLSRTVPIYLPEKQTSNRLNLTAPAGNELKYDPNEISFEESRDNHLSLNENLSHVSSNDSQNLPITIENFEPNPNHQSTPNNNIQMGGPRRYNSCLQKKIFNNIMENKREASPKKTPQPPPVAKWLEELSKLYEAECMVTLQSKSLAAHLSKQVAESATQATITIKSLFAHSKIIYSDFYTILRQLSSNKFEHLGPLIQSLNGNITEFILNYIINSQASSLTKTEERGQDVQEILQLCDFLRTATTTDCSIEDLELNVKKLKALFREVERGILAIQIQLLINMIDEPTTELALRGAVQGVTWVSTQQSVAASNLLIRCGAPRALLTVCLDSKASTLRAATLRALATVCSTSEAIRQIEQAGGIEIIADILSEDSRPEPELSEAVAVIAQITAPWIEDNHTISGLKENAKSLITSLTRFLTTSQCCQNLLLCAAALANISCMEPSTVWPLLQCHTAEKLLTTVQKRGPKISVFLKEQVATLLANMSAANESRIQLGEAKAVAALLCFLQIPPTTFDEARASEQAASLRLQQKSAIALSRLCNERSISQQVVELGGVNQLVRLCKEKRERSHSDAVLVACLATLRKIASNCGNNVMEEQDAMELVEPRLLDSFLTYSAQNESYV